MTLDVLLVAVGLLGLPIAAASARIRQVPVSEPLLALAAGVLVGPECLDVLALRDITDDHAIVHDAVRLLLAISVMGVALRYPLATARSQLRPVLLLLLLALPAMALISTGLTFWILGSSVGAALLLGTALSPTDPVLASSVVTGRPAAEDLPDRDRQVLSLESGANDGLALVLVLVAIAVAGHVTAGRTAVDLLWQVLGAVVLGVVVGWLAGRSLRLGEAHGATDHAPMLFFAMLLALLVLGLSGVLHLDGVLAAFVTGLAFNATSTVGERTTEAGADEAINRFVVLPVFVLIGATIPWQVWAELGWPAVALTTAVLLLRRLPVLAVLRRPLGLGWPDAAYLGWFGPVGVSAVFYLTLEAEQLGVSDTVLGAGTMVVVASTLAHGLSSAPGRIAYRRLAGGGSEATSRGRGASS